MNRKILRQTLKRKKISPKEIILFNYFEQTKIQENYLRSKLLNHRSEMPPLEMFPHRKLTKKIEDFVKKRSINKEAKEKIQMDFFNGTSSKNYKDLNDDSLAEQNEIRSKPKFNSLGVESNEVRLNKNEEKRIQSFIYSKKFNSLSDGRIQKDGLEEEIREKNNENEAIEFSNNKKKGNRLLKTINFSNDLQEIKESSYFIKQNNAYLKDGEKDSTSNEYKLNQKSLSKERTDFLESYFSENNLKKKAIISSKHNMFRLKPQNSLVLKYSYKEFN